MPLQAPLPLTLSVLKPLMTVSQVKGCLDVSEDQVKASIEEGVFEWAFNIASKDADRMEIRVLAVCVAKVQIELAGDDAPLPRIPTNMTEVMTSIFGPKKAHLLGATIYRAWNCGSDHLIQLVLENSLSRIPRTTFRAGRGGSPIIAWETVSKFLESRRIT